MARFQIGSDNYKYIYSDSNMEAHGKPVYRCCRGTEKSTAGQVLWLHQDGARYWRAIEAPAETTEPIVEGKKVFRTQRNDIDDINEPGNVDWQWWDAAKDKWVNFTRPFPTKRVV